LQYYSSALEQQRSDLQELYQQTRNQESIVQHFRNNDPTYQHVKKSVESKVVVVFSNSKPLLQFVARTLFHSMISDPNNCAALIYYMGGEEIRGRIIQAASNEEPLPQPSLTQAERADLCMSIIEEETEKVYGDSIRRLARKFLEEYVSMSGCTNTSDKVKQEEVKW
jgi:hypothetical protein